MSPMSYRAERQMDCALSFVLPSPGVLGVLAFLCCPGWASIELSAGSFRSFQSVLTMWSLATAPCRALCQQTPGEPGPIE